VTGALGILNTIALILLLIQYELASVVGGRLKRLARYSIVAITPLAVIFLMVVVSSWPA
jgi:hypothetical protein